MSWRRANKIKVVLIPPIAAAVFALGLGGSIVVLMALSWVTWWDAAMGAWRADEPS